MIAGALVVAASATAPAGAAEVVGSDFTGTADVASSVNTARAPGTPPAASTTPPTPSAAGVIVSIRLKHGTSGADPGTHAYAILSGTLPTLAARTDPRLASVPAPANATPGVQSIVPTDVAGLARGIPIAPGELVGYSRLGGAAGEGLRTVDTSAPGGNTHTVNTATHTSGAATYTADGGNRELLLQYTVEPDADGDAYGDESQDACPARPGSCLPAAGTPAAGPAGPAQVQIQSLPTFGGAPNVSLALGATKVKPGKKITAVLTNSNTFAVKGSLAIQTKDKFRVIVSAKQPLAIATRRISIPARGSQKISFSLPKELRKRFKRKRKLALSLTARLTDPAGVEKTVKQRPTLKASK